MIHTFGQKTAIINTCANSCEELAAIILCGFATAADPEMFRFCSPGDDFTLSGVHVLDATLVLGRCPCVR